MSQWQQVAITLAAAISSLLSLTGSGVIAYMAAQRRYSIKYRLLLSLAVADIINSTVFLLWPLPIPAGTPGVWGAIGNRRTCNVQGFFLQFGILGSFYNAALSGYFMLTLCDRMTERQIAQRYEIVTHAFAILWSAGTGLVALWPLDLYSFCALGCWIAPEPVRCHTRDDVDCVRNNRAYMYVWLFTGVPLLLCLAFIVVTMVRIYYTVRAVSLRADRITFSASLDRIRVPTANDDTKNNSSSNNINNIDGNGNGDNTDKAKGKTLEQKSRYAIRVQETAMQALLYVAAYIATHLFAFTCVIIEQAGGTNPFYTLFLENLSWPLQGFFNVFVFLRPRIQSLRKDNPDISYWQAAVWAAFHDGQNSNQKSSHPKQNRQWRTDKARFTNGSHSGLQINRRSSNLSETPQGMARRLSGKIRFSSEGDEMMDSAVAAPDSHVLQQGSFSGSIHSSNVQSHPISSQFESTADVCTEESKCEEVDFSSGMQSQQRQLVQEEQQEGGEKTKLSSETPHDTVEAIASSVERYNSKLTKYVKE